MNTTTQLFCIHRNGQNVITKSVRMNSGNLQVYRLLMFCITLLTFVLFAAAGYGTVTNTTTNATFATIQAAINDGGTSNGDTLLVSSGTYDQQVLVTKSVKIIGTG